MRTKLAWLILIVALTGCSREQEKRVEGGVSKSLRAAGDAYKIFRLLKR